MTEHTPTPETQKHDSEGPVAGNGKTTAEGLEDTASQVAATPSDKFTKSKDGAPQGTEPEPRLSLSAERYKLYKQVKEELAGKSLHDEEIQYELARWVELLETSNDEMQLTSKERAGQSDEKQEQAKHALVRRLVRKAGAAIPALISDKPELVFARTLRIRAEMQLLRRNGWSTRHLVSLTDGSPTMIVGLGVLGAAVAGLSGNLLWPWLQANGLGANFIPLDALHAPVVVAAAYLGGLVSILSRLQSFSKLRDFDPMFLFLNALAKPFVGAVFGLFAYAAVKSGLVPLDQEIVDAADLYHLWAIGFLAGFSERFANDLVSRGEGLAAPKKS
jgi:hypothetical protein